MKNLTPELIAKAKTAKSAEELLALAKDNNVELTEEEAKTYFEQLNANGAVSDDELDGVAGGSFLGISCPSEDDKPVGRCLHCGSTNIGTHVDPDGGWSFKCNDCGRLVPNATRTRAL
jgi:hypothetical protein